jgi:hypothetical protein
VAFNLFTQQDLEDVLGRHTVARIADSNNDGNPDAGVINRLIRDASSAIISAMQSEGLPIDVIQAGVEAGTLDEPRRLALEYAHAQAMTRWPTILECEVRDGIALRQHVLKEAAGLGKATSITYKVPAKTPQIDDPSVLPQASSTETTAAAVEQQQIGGVLVTDLDTFAEDGFGSF